MKSIVILSVLIVAASAHHSSYFAAPGEITGETYDDFDKFFNNGSRTATGVAGKKGENLDFCYISVQFQAKSQSCGCFIYDANYVATTARCVYDTSEGRATNIVVTFPQVSGKTATQRNLYFYLPDGTNGGAAIAAYDPAADTPFTTIGPNNIALIRLTNTLTLDGTKIQKATIAPFTDVDDFMSKINGYKFRSCGVGVVGNYGEKPKGLICTDVNPIGASCGDDVVTPDNAVCLQWKDRDNNICVGDYGGPVWAYQADAKGKVTSQQVFCMSVGSPDQRSGAPCLDAHRVICMFIPVTVKLWIDNIIASPPAQI